MKNMKNTDFKTQCIMQLKTRIILPQKASLVRNATNVRFCHIEGKSPVYNVFVLSETAHIIKLSQLLVDCGIVDGYKIIRVNGAIDDVQLFCKKYYEYSVNGEQHHLIYEKMLPWSLVKVTADDIKYIIANLVVERCMKNEPIKPLTPVMQMPKYFTHKRAA